MTVFFQSGLQWVPIIHQLRSQKIKLNTAQRPWVLSAVCNWASPAVRGSCYVTRNCCHCALWDNNGNVMALPNQGRWLPLCTCLQQVSTSSSTEEPVDSSGQQMGRRHSRRASHQSVWTPKKKLQCGKEVKPERARRLDKLES